ncbi:hypothetical protein J6TS2_45110 [Heyndrickxia sporothermodurans]|nr:hypothetical protein J6TS2_45110 [Heyndrickxia sporothermodurans]
MKSAILNVVGMSCENCVTAIEEGLGNLSGVKDVSIDLDNGKVRLQFNSAIVSLNEIMDTINDQGFDVK